MPARPLETQWPGTLNHGSQEPRRPHGESLNFWPVHIELSQTVEISSSLDCTLRSQTATTNDDKPYSHWSSVAAQGARVNMYIKISWLCVGTQSPPEFSASHLRRSVQHLVLAIQSSLFVASCFHLLSCSENWQNTDFLQRRPSSPNIRWGCSLWRTDLRAEPFLSNKLYLPRGCCLSWTQLNSVTLCAQCLDFLVWTFYLLDHLNSSEYVSTYCLLY